MSTFTNRRSALEAQVIKRAQCDAAYRQFLLTNPRQAIEQELGITVPSGVNVKVLEQTHSDAYLLLPPMETAQAEQLSGQHGVSPDSSWGANCTGC